MPIPSAEAAPRSFDSRNITAGALAVAALLVSFIGFFSWETWRGEKTKTLGSLQTTAEIESRALDLYFRRHEKALEALRDDIFDSSGRLLPAAWVYAALWRAQQREPDWVVTAINDLDGNILNSSRGTPSVRTPVAADWIRSIEAFRQGAKMSIGRANVSRLTREWVVPLRFGVRDREGKLIYVLLAIMPLSKPISFWEGAQFPPGGGVGVMHVADAVYLIGRYPLPANADAADIFGKPRPGEFAKSLMSGNLPHSGYYDGRAALTGVSSLWGYARLANYPLIFFIQSPTS